MKIAVFNFNGILDSLVNYLYMGGALEPNWHKADVVVLWQDVLGNMVQVAHEAKTLGKKVLVAEHGLLSINDYIPPLSRPLVADKFMAWGKKSKEYMLEAGIDEDKVVVTGTAVFDVFKPKRIHEGKNVLFAPRHWSPEIPENLKMAKELSKLEGVNVRSKIVKGEHDPVDYPNPISTDRQDSEHLLRTWDVLSETDVLVTMGEGTIASLAYYLDIPVVSINEWKTKELLGKKYTKKIFFEQVSDACHLVPLSKLNETVMSELEDPTQMRQKRLEFLRDHVDYDSKVPALQKMLDVIYE